MPIYSIKEIAQLIEKPAKTVEVYCVRKKLVKNSDKRIDTLNPVNKIFLAKYIVHNNTIQSEIPTSPPETKPGTEKKNGKDKSEIVIGTAMMQVEYAIKKLQAEKLKEEVQLKKEELKKKRSEVIDLAQTLSVTSAYSDNLKKNFTQKMQLLIMDICSRYEIPSDKAGTYSLKVIDLINESSKESVSILRELDNE